MLATLYFAKRFIVSFLGNLTAVGVAFFWITVYAIDKTRQFFAI